ncbi:MAG: hypothetical protein KKB31_01380, partial [Nanoarchaeota archaeon]|nr:hypothetical protein [Nanoarchaeota archaeon]
IEGFVNGEIIDLSKEWYQVDKSEAKLFSKLADELEKTSKMFVSATNKSIGGADGAIIGELRMASKYAGRGMDSKRIRINFNDLDRSESFSNVLKNNNISGLKFNDRDTIGRYVKAQAIIPEKVKTKSQLIDIYNQATAKPSLDVEPSLLQEAKKYKSAEEFRQSIPQSNRFFVESITEDLAKTKKALEFNDIIKKGDEIPKTIKIYRAVDTVEGVIRPYDFVGLKENVVSRFRGKGANIISEEIPINTLGQWTTPDTFVKLPKPLTKLEAKSQLTDIYNKATQEVKPEIPKKLPKEQIEIREQLREPKRTDPACCKAVRKVLEQDPNAKLVRGIYSTDLESAADKYEQNISNNRNNQLGHFDHIRAISDGEIIESKFLLPKKAKFFSENQINKELAEPAEDRKTPTPTPTLFEPEAIEGVDSEVVRATEEYQTISDELKKEITPFFRPSRKRVSGAFLLLGNKDTTILLFKTIFNEWVKSGVDTIIEPYAGAFTLGTHSIKDAIKSGLKRFDSNIFDKEKYIVVKAIQDGRIKQVKKSVDKAVKVLNSRIKLASITEPSVKKVFDDFFDQYPDSYIGSKQWYGYVRGTDVGKEVLVYEDVKNKFSKVFQKAFADINKADVNNLDSAVMRSFIRRVSIRGGIGQGLLRQNGFIPFENIIFNENYGMVKAFDDISDTFRLAKKHNTKINLANKDGERFIKSLKITNPQKTGFYFDPPYVKSAKVYAKNLPPAEASQLAKFESGEYLVDSHKTAFDLQKKGARMALTNDVDQEYLEAVKGEMPNSKIFAYKEGLTPTSLVVSDDTSNVVNKFLTEAEKPAAEREEIARIKELKSEKGLSNFTVSRIRKAIGITELKNATPKKLDELISILEGMEYGDNLLTPLQLEGLKDLIKDAKFDKKQELLTQREIREAFM